MSAKLHSLTKRQAMLLRRALDFYQPHRYLKDMDPEIVEDRNYLMSQLDGIIQYHEKQSC